MPLAGGLPTRRTFAGQSATVVGWTPDGKILYATQKYATLPNTQLVVLDPATNAESLLPLSQAADGSFDPSGRTLYFTRLPFQGSYTKRYKGGTAQNLWSYALGAAEAAPLTADYAGTSKNPMIWQDRIYFLSDRDGSMNIWSMDLKGGGLKQHTFHKGFDASAPSLDAGRIAYQLVADLRVFDIASGQDTGIAITLPSDFDQMREKWVTKPLDYLTSGHVSPTGDRVVLVSRGHVFVAPVGDGRWVRVSRKEGVRARAARFMGDGKSPHGPHRRDRRVGVPSLRRRRPRPGRADDDGGQGHPLRRRPVPRRQVARLRRQGQPALAFRHRQESPEPDRRFRHRHVRRPGLVPRQPLAGLCPGRFERLQSDRAPRGRDGPARGAHERPGRLLRSRLEPGRQVDLLPLGPLFPERRGQSLGAAPARALLRQDDQDLRRRSERQGPLPLRPGHRAPGGEERRRRGQALGGEDRRRGRRSRPRRRPSRFPP